jgi:Tol biopolymer transport system component
MWAYVAPDGQTITFSRSRDGGQTWELLRTTRDGAPPVAFLRVSVAVSATRASWSRRHNRLAFTGGTRGDDSTALWVSDAAGRAVTRVPAQVSHRIFYPSWRPDGRTLVAVDYRAIGGSTLVEIDVETGAVKTLTRPTEFQVGMPAVAPDGEAIVFAGQRNEGSGSDQTKNQIWLLPRGGAPRELSRGQGRQPDWSPDGRWVAFTSNRGDSAGRHAVFIVARDGGEPIRLTDYDSNGQHPVWSPDGQWLLFSAQIPGKARPFGLAVIPAPRAMR